MPTYEYKCKDCGVVFEAFQNFNDPPLEACVQCGGKAKRLLSGGAGIIFKGSGFYSTDRKALSTKGKDEQPAKPCENASKGNPACATCAAAAGASGTGG